MPQYDHDAIRKAYPTAVSIDDDQDPGVFDANGDAVSIDQTLVDAARVELDKLSYQYDRRVGTATTAGYINVKEQLDQLFHDIESGKFGEDAKTGDWYVGISSVKTNFPKPS